MSISDSIEGKALWLILRVIFFELLLISMKASKRAWTVEFQGVAHQALLEHLDHLERTFPTDRNRYKLLPVVQSSGTGKSRLLDELAKTVYVIPLNVQPLEVDSMFFKGYNPIFLTDVSFSCDMQVGPDRTRGFWTFGIRGKAPGKTKPLHGSFYNLFSTTQQSKRHSLLRGIVCRPQT